MLPSLLVTAVLAAGPAPNADDTALARELLQRIEQRHARSQGLKARFVQSYRSGMLGREVVERGVVSIKRPGRMRWEYKDPEKKIFVSDGKTFYFYVPTDRQVIVREQDQERSIPSLLLSGKRDILDQFEASLEPAPGEGLMRLRLLPRKPEPDIERVFVDAEPSGRVHAIEVEDVQGNHSRFRFEDIREGVRLPDRLFRFEIPAGVEVIQG